MTAHTTLEMDGRFEHSQLVLDHPPVLPEGSLVRIHIMIKPKIYAVMAEGLFRTNCGRSRPVPGTASAR